MNFSKIRMMFFDFDDTLLVHYREQKLDATADAHRARLLRYEAENRGGYKVFDEIGEANTLVQLSSKAATVSRNTASPVCRTV